MFKKFILAFLFVINTAPSIFLSYANADDDIKDVLFYKDDKIETLALYKDKYVLLKFWATWCPYCKQQMPAYSLLKERYKDSDKIEFIALSIDDEGYNKVKSYFDQNNIKNLDIYHDSNKNLFRSLGIRGVPTILLISPEGSIIKTYNGMKYIDIEYLDGLVEGGNKAEPKS